MKKEIKRRNFLAKMVRDPKGPFTKKVEKDKTKYTRKVKHVQSFKEWNEMTTTANVPGAGDDSSVVPVFRRKKRKMFDVPSHIFTRFKNNERVKYERWAKYIGSGMYEDGVLNYIKDNPGVEIILRDLVSLETKSITSE